jgi:hypothetical protein
MGITEISKVTKLERSERRGLEAKGEKIIAFSMAILILIWHL